MGDERHLSWKSHHATLVSIFSTLLENQTLVDAVLTIDNESIQAHRLVLCACSPYFQEILTTQQPKLGPAVIYLSGYSMEDVKAIVRYMYCGEILVPATQMRSFLLTAKALQIRGLSKDLPPVFRRQHLNIPVVTIPTVPDIRPISTFCENDSDIPHFSIPLSLSNLPGISCFDKTPPVATVVAQPRRSLHPIHSSIVDADHLSFTASLANNKHDFSSPTLPVYSQSNATILISENNASQPEKSKNQDQNYALQNNKQFPTGQSSEPEAIRLNSDENEDDPLEINPSKTNTKVEHIEVAPEILHVWNYQSQENSTEEPIVNIPKVPTRRPYCPKCGKRASNLAIHLLVCEAVRRVQTGRGLKCKRKMCNLCGVWVVHMNRHLKNVHNNKASSVMPPMKTLQKKAVIPPVKILQKKACPNCGVLVLHLTKHLKCCQVAAKFAEGNLGVNAASALTVIKKPAKKTTCPRCGNAVTKLKRHLMCCKGPSTD